MERIPEPELMEDPAQALAYAEADFAAAHGALVEHLAALHPPHETIRRIVDLGCGPGDVSVRAAAAYPGATVLGIDASAPMVELARRRAARERVTSRVRFRVSRIGDALPDGIGCDLLLSTSVLHHMDDPAVLWSAVRTLAGRETRVFVADLRRPPSRSAAEEIVARDSGGEPEVLRRDFFNSLLAAYTPGEVAAQLSAEGLHWLRVEPFGERHLVVHGLMST